LLRQHCPAGFHTLPDRDAIWQSLFLAAPELSQAGHIATALHPGHSALVRGSHSGISMYAQLTSWDNLLLAYRRASKGKRSQPAVAVC
jgi:hypothetical protein